MRFENAFLYRAFSAGKQLHHSTFALVQRITNVTYMLVLVLHTFIFYISFLLDGLLGCVGTYTRRETLDCERRCWKHHKMCSRHCLGMLHVL